MYRYVRSIRLEDYQTELIHHILAEDFMDTNEQIINQVDSVTQLLSDILQDFVRVEIDLASQKNTTLVRSLILLTIVELGVLSTIFFYAKKNRRFFRTKGPRADQSADHNVRTAFFRKSWISFKHARNTRTTDTYR